MFTFSAKIARAGLIAAALMAGVGAAGATEVKINSETPAISVDVPAGFATSESSRGILAKSADGGTYVWFETYQPEEVDTLIKEHEDYWAKNEVALGDNSDKVTKEFDGKKVIATDFKGATWKGKPTVVRYLFIDAALPSKKLLLMTLWASPDSDQANDDAVGKIISSLKMGD